MKRLRKHRPVLRLRQKHLHAEHPHDGPDQRDHQRLHVAETPALQQQDQQHVEPGDQHAIEQRNVKEQVQRDGRADDLGQVAGRDRDLRADPQRETHPRPVASWQSCARSRSVATPSFSAQALQQDRHQVRQP